MVHKDKLVELVAKLIELTQKGELKWDTDPLSMGLRLGATVRPAFIAQLEGKTLRIQEADLARLGIIGGAMRSPFQLEMVDGRGQAIWQFPDVVGLKDLYDAVQFQKSGIDDFVNKVLKR